MYDRGGELHTAVVDHLRATLVTRPISSLADAPAWCSSNKALTPCVAWLISRLPPFFSFPHFIATLEFRGVSLGVSCVLVSFTIQAQ